MRIIKYCMVLSLALFMGLSSCSFSVNKVQAANLMKDMSRGTAEGKETDAAFIENVLEFYFELFKQTAEPNENTLVSPLSVMLALAMTANGAANDTLAQMETVLGGGIALDELNRYLLRYTENLPQAGKSRVNIANSIWFRDNEDHLMVREEFLQINADYYDAQAYKLPFDAQTVKDINRWVSEKTEGMIDSILDEIRADAIMYLVNALVFDAEWETIYHKQAIFPGQFNGADGKQYDVEFMASEESFYLKDEFAVGFIKPYATGDYSFVALLPNESISLGDYIDSLTGDYFIRLLEHASREGVAVILPKFSYKYEVSMAQALSAMGMPTAFTEDADFSNLGQSSMGNIYIGDVLHKTFINVDEKGTKAGAVTKVEMRATSVQELKTVRLDRPFLYAIIDNATNMPIFIGTVNNF